MGKLESSIPGATATRRVLLILFVPSADRAGKNLTNQDEWKRLAMEFFGGHCGGATAMPRAEGIWRDDENNAAVASEVAARVLFYRHGASVDTILAHPNLVKAFDALAARLTPGHTSFEYRWAALHMRKKGANVKLRDEEIDGLQWTGPLKFTVASLPAEEGVYSLFEQGTCLFVGATEDIQESITEQRRIANVPLFGDELWIPNPGALAWRYAQLPDWTSDQRFGLVRALVGRWQPVFNIPRGSERLAA